MNLLSLLADAGHNLSDVAGVGILINTITACETTLTVHRIIPDGYPGDAFLQKTTNSIRARFGISHTIIQIETTSIMYKFHHR